MLVTVASTLLRSWNSCPAKDANWRPFSPDSSTRLSGWPHLKQSLGVGRGGEGRGGEGGGEMRGG